MADNFPGPYQMRVFYAVQGRSHVQNINCDVIGTPAIGTAFADITLVTKDAVGIAADTAVDEWVDLIDGRLATVDAVINRAELWKYTDLTDLSTFVSSYSIGVAGANGIATKPASELIMTFRTQEGGIMRIVIEESTAVVGAKQPYPPSDAGDQAIMDYVVASDTWMLAKDTSYPVVALNFLPGQNERAFKKLYRS